MKTTAFGLFLQSTLKPLRRCANKAWSRKRVGGLASKGVFMIKIVSALACALFSIVPATAQDRCSHCRAKL